MVYAMEVFVEYMQFVFPTWFLRLAVRLFMRLEGLRTRCGDVVVRQIAVDQARKSLPVTTDVDVVNEELYGNDPAFFVAHLGPRLKYSACEFPTPQSSLAEAETFTLRKYQELAGLSELPAGSRVLELGCGWGSLSLANAERFPQLAFTCFSNSPQQIEYITRQAAERKLENLTLHVEDYADFVGGSSKVSEAGRACFDAAMAIETVEHAKNISALLEAVAGRLKPGAKLFVQSLLHQSTSYLLDESTWMGRNFFTGGSILSLNSYFHLCPDSMRLVDLQPVSVDGYSLTLLAWLYQLEPQRSVMVRRYGTAFYEGFRMFYISCAESFAANKGYEFMIGYYTFEKRS